jgi:hypothetical protein
VPEGVDITARFIRSSVTSVRKDFAEMDKAAERAAMWSVREVLRKFTRGAARGAPVYKGRPRKVRVNGELIELVPRSLKKSFHSTKRLRRNGGEFSAVAGPRGPHVRLYAQAQEARRPFIKPAYSEAVSQARGIHERALERALAKVAKGRH